MRLLRRCERFPNKNTDNWVTTSKHGRMHFCSSRRPILATRAISEQKKCKMDSRQWCGRCRAPRATLLSASGHTRRDLSKCGRHRLLGAHIKHSRASRSKCELGTCISRTAMTGAQEDDFLMDANYVCGRWVWSKLSVCIYMARLRNSVKISSARSIHFHYFHLRRDERFGGGTRAVLYVVCLSRVA